MSVCSLLVSGISFVYLRPIFLFCPTCRDQQLVHHIHNGLILVILILFLSLFTDSFSSLRLHVLASNALHTYVALYSTYIYCWMELKTIIWKIRRGSQG